MTLPAHLAAHMKLCSRKRVEQAIASGALRGRPGFVTWDDAFDDWHPEAPASELCLHHNRTSYFMKAIYAFQASSARDDVRELLAARITAASDDEMWQGYGVEDRDLPNPLGSFIVPVTKENLAFLMHSQDGNYDGAPYSDEGFLEAMMMMSAGMRLYQLRIGITPIYYRVDTLLPSEFEPYGEHGLVSDAEPIACGDALVCKVRPEPMSTMHYGMVRPGDAGRAGDREPVAHGGAEMIGQIPLFKSAA